MYHTKIRLNDVRNVYDGPEGVLWELVMGEQIHAGGWKSSMELAKRAGIKKGDYGIDLCSALGAGCRFLVKNFGTTMVGLDATGTMLRKARLRARKEGFADRIKFRKGDVTDIPFGAESFDFVWGEDAWCYVVEKPLLIQEAVRILKPGGTIAFTDWLEGPAGLSENDAARFNGFMKFPNVESLTGYRKLLESAGCDIIEATDLTPEFAGLIDLYLQMLDQQLTFDALKIIGDDMELFAAMAGEMMNMSRLAHEGKIGRGRFIAKKK